MIPVPEKRISEFESKAFGMFIHYGLYSQLGKGEWIKHFAKMSDSEYNALFESFSADKFDAHSIARLAKASGMKYITLTARHHDGFSLYDTRGLSEFDAPHAPGCRRDLIKEFVDACADEGVTPMLYHTRLDWHVRSFNEDFSAYLKYLRDSVEVLCSNYGKIGGFWFDGNWSKPGEDWRESELYAVIRRHQPDAIIVNNTGLEARGKLGDPEIDSVTYEQGRPEPMNREGMSKYVAAEMCYTVNDHWGYAADDINYKSPAQLIETLCACRKIGANLLLNIGPRGDGSVEPMQRYLLECVGKWISKCGGSIYEAKPCVIKGEGKNFALCKGKKAYLFIHDIASSDRVKRFENVGEKVKSVKYTDNGEDLGFTLENGVLCVTAPPFSYGQSLAVRVAEVELE